MKSTNAAIAADENHNADDLIVPRGLSMLNSLRRQACATQSSAPLVSPMNT